MRSSRPHFKYIFHYRGADKQRRRFLRQSPFAVCLSPTEIQFPCFYPGTMSHFGDAWIVPNWKHLFQSREVNFKLCHSAAISRCFILCLTVNPTRYSPSQEHPPAGPPYIRRHLPSQDFLSLWCYLVIHYKYKCWGVLSAWWDIYITHNMPICPLEKELWHRLVV